ncbi:hypothetical protein HY990_02585 [Candidatus Micrarchaeota archaeon]|nr:hypothetical protein [Candidatus Micrarchaeota archaeon]
MTSKRGFIITIMSVSLVMMLVILTLSLRNNQLRTERALVEPLPLIYSSFLIDNVASGLNSIVGPDLGINQTNQSVIVSISDTIQSYNYSDDLLSYHSFLTGELASRTTSNISVNFTNISYGVNRLSIDEDYRYTNDHLNREIFFTKSEGTNATSYAVNFLVTAIRSNVSSMVFNENGTLNVSIQYTDLNGTTTVSGAVFPDQSNQMTVDYAGGCRMTISVGFNSADSGSLLMRTNTCDALVGFTVVLPAINETKKLGYSYDATLDYIQGNVRKNTRIGK